MFSAQMLSYLAYVMRFASDSDQPYGEKLMACSLRIMQDCPTNGVSIRKVCFSRIPRVAQ